MLYKTVYNNTERPAEKPRNTKPQTVTTIIHACKHAKDTGVRAFANLPCRGNRIECQALPGHISYTKACTPEQCRLFEKDI